MILGKYTSLRALTPRLRRVKLSLYARDNKLQMQGNEQLVATIAEMYEKFCRLEPFDGQAPRVQRYIKKKKPQYIENEQNNWHEDWGSRWNNGAYNQEWNWPQWKNRGNRWTNGWSNGWWNGWQDNEWNEEKWGWGQDEPRNWSQWSWG